ncbi:MAG: L-histidine N(alpha)-methyltransferase [Rudaea sp.]
MSHSVNADRLRDLRPSQEDILDDVLAGLRRMPKRLSPKYFYDAIGSQLFERICEQPEYYLTRTELAIMRTHIDAIGAAIGADAMLVEYGSGSGLKTRLLLRHLRTATAYVPIEISPSALHASVASLSREFPHIQMLPVCADFTEPVALPRPSRRPQRRVVYFPGSTIGNFEPHEAEKLLRQMRMEMGRDGAALIGVDLHKDVATLEAAYNDSAGVTAKFTLNMLARFNRELGADFDLTAFRHRARYNTLAGRIQTHIVSAREQDVHVGGSTVHFGEGEAMLVEYSCKYLLREFAEMAQRAGLTVAHVWCDEHRQFSVQLLVDAAAQR